jgi:hypothetical protein
MKRLVVNAFCPGEHKVISPPDADLDLPRQGYVKGGKEALSCDFDKNTRSKNLVGGTNW